MTHSAKFWNLLDERRTTAKKNTVCQISPLPPINVDHSFRHYGHFVSGQHCAGGRGRRGGGGRAEVLPRFGILENSPKTVKCVINFATDCSPGSKKRKKHGQLSDLCPALHSSVGTRLEFQGLTELECQLSNKHSCLQEKTCHFFRPHKQIKLVKENLSRETRQGESFLV